MEPGRIRAAAVAGLFYPAQREQLSAVVDALLAAIDVAAQAPPKAIIAPHAGYIYSGSVAASAYTLLRPLANVIRRVVLLGPCHHERLRGLALPAADSFMTPLGEIPLDKESVAAALQSPQVIRREQAHAREHSLEVHLPFLQRLLDEFSIVPFAVGQATPDEVAAVLDLLWGGEETLIVISSDLSHYLGYNDARQRDSNTVADITRLRSLLDQQQACGVAPINGLIEVARRRRMQPRLIDLRNSGDTAGDRSRVVGYASIAFHNSADD